MGAALILVIGGIFMLARKGRKEEKGYEREVVENDLRNVKGATDSRVVIVEFSDFECPACAVFNDVIKQVEDKYKDRVKFVYRHFPLESIHLLAYRTALAGEAAAAQGKFWELNDILYEKRDEWVELGIPELDKKLEEYAKEIEMKDVDKFMNDVREEKYASNVEADLEVANELGLQGTPTVFVNGEKFENFNSAELLEEEIEKKLKE